MACCLALWVAPAARAQTDAERSTLQKATDAAVAQALASLSSTNFPGVQHVAVVPLRGDADGYLTSGVKSGVTRGPYKLFAREDQEWNTLLGEIEWGARREDIMDPATVQKFGRIQGVDANLYGQLWDRNVNLWSIRGRAKVSLNLADVETGQILWSSGPVEGEAYMHWSDALTSFWRYPMFLTGVLVLLVILLVIWRIIRRATRPL
jgi:hypothetical protein